MAPVVTMRQLLEAGVHFGHQTRRWDPRMRRFIYGERNGIYIIDLQQTLQRIETAYSFVRDLVADGGDILFIGTKKQAQDPVAEAAAGCGMPYINERWLGGMLTNFTTMSGRVKKMTEYQRMRAVGDFDVMPKKEALMKSRELEKLERNLGGIRDMAKLPEAVFIIDTKKEHIGVTEANKLKIPIVAVVDTNCNPDIIDYVIPGNDDAIRSGTLMCRIISDAVKEGRYIAERRGTAKPRSQAPTPEQEADRARQQAEARNEAARQAAERDARLAAGATTPAADDEVDAEVPAQSSPAAGQERGGVPTPAVEAPPSDVVEATPGSIPAGDDEADVSARFPQTQPGSAETSPVGSHGGGASPAAEAGAVVREPEQSEPEATPDVANVDGAFAAEVDPAAGAAPAPGKTDTTD
ncbi:MAG: SSU ribosomal protein S2p (SAe) [uncultured Acidimicrobiales bacterium]|uniref:Small ribosomal subunit protein uS2 n=1 Tax=uncultured Acidimicrobiales bacterium TaxID=310071 RepID=A0A6J4IKJ3_9ACTN|nr:MAG: SSU ribosomal protein S2p (SAe) [uncultured Acidimicrobiales bacterium]